MFGVECGAPCLECAIGAQATLLGPADLCIPKAGCAERGQLCTGDGECESGLCIDHACAEACVVGDTTCPEGEACARFDGAGLDGMCAPTGALGAGEACTRDDLCTSLLCLDGVCAAPCDLASGEPCLEGECESTLGNETTGTCAPGSEPIPEPEEPDPAGDPDDPEAHENSSGSSSDGCAGGTPPSSVAWLLLLLLFSGWRRARP
jgi:hypothetical protein